MCLHPATGPAMPIAESAPSSADANNGLRLYQIFKGCDKLSIKLDSYFQVYEELFAPLVGQPIVFVEVGILNGGSLFMWREYFGPQARIIGIDFNPGAKQWEQHGFEIHIGDQSSDAFWDKFYQQVGPIDVLLDDGGHTNKQQLITAVKAFPQVRDGGLVVIEDVHASYLREFDNPSPRSFVNFAKFVVDSVNRRYSKLAPTRNDYWRRVHSVAFHESIVVFRIDPSRCRIGRQIDNAGVGNSAFDYRGRGVSRWLFDLDRSTQWLSRIVLVKSIKKRILRGLYFVANKVNDARLAKYFR